MRLLIADDVVKARKRMRNAWIAGFAAAGIGLINALISFPSAAAESQGGWSNGQFVFVMLESSLMAGLAYGILKRIRAAAVLLFFYFLISRIPLLAMGLIRLEVLPLQLLFGYLFFQGMRGALTFHHLTHPLPPELKGDRRPVTGSGPRT
jgi:hypothetical protein